MSPTELQVMLLTETRHRVIDRPIKTLRHQSAGLQKCSMKAGQSLFSLFAPAPALLATRGSPLENLARSRSLFSLRSARILEQKRDCSQSTLLENQLEDVRDVGHLPADSLESDNHSSTTRQLFRWCASRVGKAT